MSRRPFDASFPTTDRYTVPRDDAEVRLVVDGEERTGTVLGRNGPRVQVRFEMDGDTYVRWFDTSQVRAA